MPTTADLLNDLVEQKTKLADTLGQLGIEASDSETLNTLVPKVELASEQGMRKFADMLQNYGTRDVYTSMFIQMPNLEMIRYFNYDIKCRMCETMFSSSASDTKLYPDGLDLTKLLEETGISLTWGTNGILKSSSMFASSRITRVPPLFISSINSVSYIFENCSLLKTIDGFKFDGQANSTNFFKGCSALENITFNGKWSANISLSDSPLLTVDSIMSLFNILADYSSGTTVKTVTLGSINLAKLSDEQKAIAIDKSWNLA